MAGFSPKWRIAFFVTLIIAVAVIGLLAYSVVDQAVTITHMSDGYSRTEKDLKTLGDAFPRDRYNKKDILVVLNFMNPPTKPLIVIDYIVLFLICAVAGGSLFGYLVWVIQERRYKKATEGTGAA